MTAFGLAFVLLFQHAASSVLHPEDGNISCGNGERRASCSLCPDVFRDGELSDRDVTRCLGDCELKRVGSEYACMLQVPSAPEIDISIAPAEPPADAPAPSASHAPNPTSHPEHSTLQAISIAPANPPADNSTPSASTTPTPTSHPEHSNPQASLLSIVELKIGNSGRSRRNTVSFQAEVCVQTCCQTEFTRQRTGFFKFASNFQNLGNCAWLRKGPNDAVVVKAITGHTATPLKVYRITAQFDDGTLYTAENPVRDVYVESSSYFSSGEWRRQRSPVPWNTSRPTTRSEAPSIDPQPHCPEHLTNSCPKANVRVFEKLDDDYKFCYYQECNAYAKDLSTVENEEAGLGSGGYCKPRSDLFPQYQYCCDLEQYFTLDDEDATPKPQEEIHFPRCPFMVEMTP